MPTPRAKPAAPRAETAAELALALTAIEAMLGVGAGGLDAKRIAAIERRLGVRLPPIVRAFHATCGADERLLVPGWAGARLVPAPELRVEHGVLVVIDTPAAPRGRPGEECGVALGGARSAHAKGTFLERASPEREWNSRALGIGTRLRELATFAAVVSMRHVFAGPIRLRSREAKARLRETLEHVGADIGMRTFVDRSLGAIVWNDHLMDRITVGAPTRRAIQVLAGRLSADLVPRAVARRGALASAPARSRHRP